MRTSSTVRRLALSALRVLPVVAVLLAFGSSQAFADKIHVDKFDGPRANAMQKTVEGALKKAGHKLVGPKAANATISGEVERKGKRWKLNLTLKGPSGDTLDTITFVGRRPPQIKKKVNRKLARNVKRALSKIQVASSDEKEDKAEDKSGWSKGEGKGSWKDDKAADNKNTDVANADDANDQGSSLSVSKSSSGSGDRAPIRFAAGTRLYTRSLRYNDDLFERVNEYSVPAALEFLLGGSYDVLDSVRVGGGFAFTNPFDSRDSAGEAFPTSGYALHLGARYLYSLAGVDLGVGADFGIRTFSIDDAGEVAKPAIPSVNYRYVRAGLDARYPVMEKLDVTASLGYRHVLSSGEIGTEMYFPRSSLAGLDLMLGAQYALSSSLMVAAGVDVERYFYSLNPEPGDPWIAGGAVDQFLGGWLQLGMQL